MESGRGAYFAVLKAAFSCLATYSDSFIGDAFRRYLLTVRLLDLKSRGDREAKIDGTTGLFTRNELLRVQADLTGSSPPVSRPAESIASEFLDIILRRKQTPSPLEVELMARALYCEDVLSLRNCVDKAQCVGVSVDATLTRRSHENRQIEYGWDFWHPANGNSSIYRAWFAIPSQLENAQDAALRGMLVKTVGNCLSHEDRMLQAAVQIDENSPSARLKLMKRLKLIKLHQSLAGHSASPISDRLAGLDDPKDNWALEFEVHGLKSIGTTTRISTGLISSTSTVVEQFYIDERNEDCVANAASFVEKHILLPHGAYSALQGLPEMSGRQVHVLVNGSLAENI